MTTELESPLSTEGQLHAGEGKHQSALPSQSEVGHLYDDQTEEDDDVNGPCCDVSYFPMEVRVRGCGRLLLRFNPIVFFLSIAVILGFVIWAAADAKNAGIEIAKWQTWIVGSFTWLYNGSLVIFMVFCLYLVFSEYGSMKLGLPDEEPDFSLVSWFTMLFSAGIGIGLFFFGVGEPVAHYADAQAGGNRFANLPLNEQATAALNLTWFHWGFAASSVYCIVGLPLAFFAHRKKLPMTIRTCFYSLFGENVKGPVGDILDALAVIGTMFGVGTSLGLGVLQLSTGLHRVNPSIPDSEGGRVVIICIITAMATISVVSGLDVGIRRLSEGNFLFGLILLFFLFFAGGSVFQLDLFVQTVGYHLQWLLKLMFHTDAWERTGFNGTAFPKAYSSAADQTDPKAWMSSWSVFYWAWWIAWSPFVGVFIATISKGRTIREFILGNVFVPTVFTSIWLTIFGGLGIRMEMTAQLHGYVCNKNAPLGVSGPISPVPKQFVRLSCRSYTNRLFDLIDSFPFSNFISVITIISLTTYFVTSSDSASHVIDVITCNGRKEPPVLQRIFWAVMEGVVALVLLVAGGSEALAALQTASIAAGLPFTFVLLLMVVATKKALDIEMGYAPDPTGVLSPATKAQPQAGQKRDLYRVPTADTGDEKFETGDLNVDVDDVGSGSDDGLSGKTTHFDKSLSHWGTSKCAIVSCQVTNWKYAIFATWPGPLQIKAQLDTGMYNAELFDSPTQQNCSKCLLFSLLGLPFPLVLIFASLGTAINSGYHALAGLAVLVYLSASAYYRLKLRTAYGVHGSVLGDCGAIVCCWNCAAYQEAMQVELVGQAPNMLAQI